MNYTKVRSPLGPVHLLASERGLAALYFDPQAGDMDRRFPRRERAGAGRNRWLLRAEAFVARYFAGDVEYSPDLSFDLTGTEFQLSVWDELRSLPPGVTCTYGELARRLGRACGPRAVGAAVGRNPVSLLVPCHRVIGASGRLTGYAGGLERKQFLLDHEREHAARMAA
jgi:methylated-DNA-[protein]-cysteine S-methyltransferase